MGNPFQNMDFHMWSYVTKKSVNKWKKKLLIKNFSIRRELIGIWSSNAQVRKTEAWRNKWYGHGHNKWEETGISILASICFTFYWLHGHARFLEMQNWQDEVTKKSVVIWSRIILKRSSNRAEALLTFRSYFNKYLWNIYYFFFF